MKIALVFAQKAPADRLVARFRSSDFIRALHQEGLEPMIVQLQDGDFPAVGSSETNAGDLAASTYLCDEASLASFLRVAQTLVVYTFGDVTRLASVWTHAAQVGCALVHFV